LGLRDWKILSSFVIKNSRAGHERKKTLIFKHILPKPKDSVT